MRIAIDFITLLLSAVIACGYPFVTVLRGKGIIRPIGIAWALVVVLMLVLCIGVPMIVHIFSPQFAQEMSISWLPAARNIVPVIFMGWMVPSIAAIAAIFIRQILRIFWPKVFARIDESPLTYDANM